MMWLLAHPWAAPGRAGFRATRNPKANPETLDPKP